MPLESSHSDVLAKAGRLVTLSVLMLIGLLMAGCEQFHIDTARGQVFRIIQVKVEKETIAATKPGAKPQEKELLRVVGQGTAFLVQGPNVVATNEHVVDKVDGVTHKAILLVSTVRGMRLINATLVLKDASRDLAVLQAESTLVDAVKPLALAEYLPDRQSAVQALGYPSRADALLRDSNSEQSLEKAWQSNPTATTTQGMVSHSRHGQSNVRFVQHSAMVSPGNSGGPLFDSCGAVVGINTRSAEEGIYASVSSLELIAIMRQTGRAPDVRSGCNFQNTERYFPLALGVTAVLLASVSIVLAFRRTAARRRGLTMMTRSAQGNVTDLTVTPPRLAQQRQRQQGSAAPNAAAAHSAFQPHKTRSSPAGEQAVAGEIRLEPTGSASPIAVRWERLASGQGLMVGRNPDCDIVITDNTVSKRHAKISMGGPGKLVVEDQQSGNGTWRDGQRIKCETFASGDVIKFGSAEFRLQLPGDRSPAPRNGMHPTVFNDSSGRDRGPPATPGPSERTWMLSGHDEKGMVIQFPLRPRSDGSEGRQQ
jgi:hypothetical protein